MIPTPADHDLPHGKKGFYEEDHIDDPFPSGKYP
jgi:hypothetical protein